MSNLNGKGAVLNNSTCFAGRGAYRSDLSYKRHFVNAANNIFPSLEDNLMGRPSDPLAKHVPNSGPSTGAVHLKHEVMYGAHPPMNHPMDTLELMEPTLCTPSLPPLPPDSATGLYSHHAINVMPTTTQPHLSSLHHHHNHAYRGAVAGLPTSHGAEDYDPRDLEAFAERFKQRRIKLGVTQADVGRALVHLKIPGVGTLSQSTICRFESLTLSRNNMAALRPVLQSWLEAAESQARGKNKQRDALLPFVLPSGEKKRKRTSIAAVEKRSLEAYFAVQQRPSGEKIASIAEKLDLKKSVVRVWFCNQRQKQKRMKYSASQNMN